MSTATQLDAVSELASFARNCAEFYAKDLNALPEGAYSQPYREGARTIQEVTAEVCDFNQYMVSALKGQPKAPPTEDERKAFAASLDTPEKGAAAVRESANAMADALIAGRDSLSEMMAAPWGTEISKFGMALIATNHIMYHDAQINYLQSLHGDQEMHWFDA